MCWQNQAVKPTPTTIYGFWCAEWSFHYWDDDRFREYLLRRAERMPVLCFTSDLPKCNTPGSPRVVTGEPGVGKTFGTLLWLAQEEFTTVDTTQPALFVYTRDLETLTTIKKTFLEGGELLNFIMRAGEKCPHLRWRLPPGDSENGDIGKWVRKHPRLLAADDERGHRVSGWLDSLIPRVRLLLIVDVDIRDCTWHTLGSTVQAIEGLYDAWDRNCENLKVFLLTRETELDRLIDEPRYPWDKMTTTGLHRDDLKESEWSYSWHGGNLGIRGDVLKVPRWLRSWGVQRMCRGCASCHRFARDIADRNCSCDTSRKRDERKVLEGVAWGRHISEDAQGVLRALETRGVVVENRIASRMVEICIDKHGRPDTAAGPSREPEEDPGAVVEEVSEMTLSEALAFLFLFNLAASAGQYAGPKFIESVGQILRKLGHTDAWRFRAGGLDPENGEQEKTLEELERFLNAKGKITLFSSLDSAELKVRVTRCLAKHFDSDEMRGPLKTNAKIKRAIGTPSQDPSVVADELYDLACKEGKVHWLVNAMVRYQGSEATVRDCLLKQD